MLYDRLAELMNDLRREYRGPVFDPHVTLLGEMEGDEGDFCKKAEVLVQHLHALEIRLCAPGYEEDFFRCLYFSVDNTPALREAHQRAKQKLWAHSAFGVLPPCESPIRPVFVTSEEEHDSIPSSGFASIG